MPGYRLYFMNRAGHVQSAREFTAADDQAAVTHANQQLAGEIAELWDRGRRVQCFEPELLQPPSKT